MQIEVPTEQSVIREALQVLMTHMEPVKVARFIVACKLGQGDYLDMKDQLFTGETVNSLYDKIQAFEKTNNV
ncbi:MAG: hypothetical protein F6J97_21825 [Leptolyngbya sp. SIO4C1]|nr:hypothetical protein [Leptolyngbya sp. SIO4C1]